MCEPEAPGLVEYDESIGVFAVKEASLKRTQEELKQLLEASYMCPMWAFQVTLVDGKTYYIRDEQWIRDAISKGDYEWA
jgi:hypothetical protein